MGATLNRIQIIGRLGHGPKSAGEGKSFRATFSVATEDYKGESVTWHNVVCWGGTAQAVMKCLDRGSLVYVEGELQKRSAKNRDGEMKEYVDINARSVQFLVPPTNDRAYGPADDTPTNSPADNTPPNDDDIPF